MKKHLLNFAFLLIALSLSAQWVQVETGLDGFPPTALSPIIDDMVLGTAGGGLYMTTNNGANWTNINSNIGNLYINNIFTIPSNSNDEFALFVATEGGAYYSMSDLNYENCSSGIPTSDINLYWPLGLDINEEAFLIATNGEGIFVSDEYNGPWVSANAGIDPGDGSNINAIAGYSDGSIDYHVLATDGGVYWKIQPENTWVENTVGLSGNSLKVHGILSLGSFVLIATYSGLHYTLDFGDTWITLIPDEKFNLLIGGQMAASPTGMYGFIGGEKSYYSNNFQDWFEIDMSGIDGEVTAANVTSTDLYLGVTNTSKENEDTGGLYRIPLTEIESVFVGTQNDDLIKETSNMEQNYPNPFTHTTKISYALQESGSVDLKVHDIFGREVMSLVHEFQVSGNYSVNIDARALQGQIFFYSLELNGIAIETKKMMIIR